MKPTKKPEHLSALLPGLEWSATVEQAKDRHDTPERHGRWWVRSSAQQKLCPATGRPLGFRHSLMHGSKVVRSGVGADAIRSFTAQAEFLHTHELSKEPHSPDLPSHHPNLPTKHNTMKTKLKKKNHASEATTPKTNPTISLDTKLDRPSMASLLAKFKTADGKSKYAMIQDKPVIFIDVKTVLTVESEKFQDKLLCDGFTMNAGDACVFSCTFCYVPAAMLKLHSAMLAAFNLETGLNLGLEEVVIRRRGFLDVLKKQLLHTDGSRIYDDPNDNRVLYSSTLVDVAANMELLQETADACIIVFENTEWQIRLLSKSPLLKLLVTKNMIPEQYHSRLILGFSTGTLDDKLAASIERGTGLVSKRIKALHELQDLGIRTFGMICPSLPYGTQDEYDEFSRAMCDALRIDRCEHVWAEVINLRGDSLKTTAAALREAGYEAEAERLEAVSGPGSKEAWEEYASMTFEAHKKHVPAGKLRFLQYVKKDTVDCWSCMRSSGAVLLGSYAEDNNLITIGTSAPTEPLPDLRDEDIRYLEQREKIVTKAFNDRLATAKALHEIKSYRDGLLWRKEFRTFADYCQKRWDYQKSQAYRHVQAGEFLARLEHADSPIGENLGMTESHLRPVLENVPEELQVECWQAVTKSIPEVGKLTAAHVKNETKHFLKKKCIESKKKKPAKPTKPDDRESVMRDVAKLRASLARLPQPERFDSLLQDIETLIDQDPDEPIPVEATEDVTCDRNVPVPAAHSERNGHAEAKESPVLQQEKGDITAEIVAAAMVAVAPPHEQSMGTANLEKETSVYQRKLAVTEKCARTSTTESKSQQDTQDTAQFMSAQHFHDVLHPGEDYTTWLGKTAESHPADVRIPDDGGAARISLIRAKNFAFHKDKSTDKTALKLITEACDSSNSNPGKTADALFKQHALTANHSSS